VGDYHPTPERQLALTTSGELEVIVSDGAVRRIGPNLVVLLEDMVSKGHLTCVLGTADLNGVFVWLDG